MRNYFKKNIAVFILAQFSIITLSSYVYIKEFNYHPIIILFDMAFIASIFIILILIIGLVKRLQNFFQSSASNILAISNFLVIVLTITVFSLSFLSNIAWGDTFKANLIFTLFKYNIDQFNPLNNNYLNASLSKYSFIILLFLLPIFVIYSVYNFIFSYYSNVNYGMIKEKYENHKLFRKFLYISIICIIPLSAIGIFNDNQRRLVGDPFIGFFDLIPLSNYTSFDNEKIEAAIKDREISVQYNQKSQFKEKNIILIISDALRADHMNVYGYDRQTTPFLSSLLNGNKLIKIKNAFSMCSETFCGVATTLASKNLNLISTENFKVHDLLHNVGYKINFYLSGEHRNWSYLWDFYGKNIDNLYDHVILNSKDMHDDRIILNQLSKIANATNDMNFFYIHLMSTHGLGVKLPEFEIYKPVITEKLRNVAFWSKLHQFFPNAYKENRISQIEIDAMTNLYDNSIYQVDHFIENIFSILDQKGYLKNSLVFIIGDHGEGLGEHGHFGHSFHLHQEDIGIPMLIYDNDLSFIKNIEFASQLDIAPTMIDRLGLKIPESWQGNSLHQETNNRFTIHQTRRGLSPCFAFVMRKDHRIIKFMKCGDSTITDKNLSEFFSEEELYDLSNDPHEKNNLIEKEKFPELELFREEYNKRMRLIQLGCLRDRCK